MTFVFEERYRKGAVALAPMSGVSDIAFRRVVARAGADIVVSEMVASDALADERPDMVRRAALDETFAPSVIQLAGREPSWMKEGARLAEAAGADVIDINMGCPSRQVTGALSGSALMRDPDHALALIEATIAGTSKPVTLKMRLGWDWNTLNAPFIANRAEAAGIKAFVVHGRTRCDFYNGQANWSAIRETVDAVNAPVFVNGDIQTLDDARKALAQSRAAGVMIGRAAQGRPWLPGAIARALREEGDMIEPSIDAQRDMAIQHYDDTLSFYGDRLGVRIARKHLSSYVEHAPVVMDPVHRRAARSAICRFADPQAVKDSLHAVFAGETNFGAIAA